ncbi:nicotinate (nicotinamide) nucleotide adenylyltransferase [Mycoplasma suis]|uniref:Probable nicotinate-nucleotide adenylyltransferase n=1 Tax=Mycoplasma suis (strain Illinois) TaxID=768700 RepID=F0QQX1_MYCSL|nr:putative nicotinate-nucleotide adenylyltransferase [Mycoplasma suis str. Illinois]
MYPYKPLRIGLFGGSFNPPHLGHNYLAKYAIKKLKLDWLIFIPAYQSVEKPKNIYASAADRLQMINLSFPKKKTIVSSFELNLQQAVESIITVKHFKNLFSSSDLYFLFGEDHCPTLHTWENIRELFSLASPVMFKRNKPFSLEKTLSYFEKLEISNVQILNNCYVPFSSSQFRTFGKKKFLHKNVQKYIKSKKLYLHT